MRSKFITTLSIFAVVASVLGLASGTLQLLAFQGLKDHPDLAALTLEAVSQQMGASVTLVELEQMLLDHGLFSMVTSILGVALGYGLWRRRAWARTGSIYLILVMTLWLVSSSVSSALPLSNWMYWFGLAFAALIAGIHAGIIVKLRSPEVRAEFSQAC